MLQPNLSSVREALRYPEACAIEVSKDRSKELARSLPERRRYGAR